MKNILITFLLILAFESFYAQTPDSIVKKEKYWKQETIKETSKFGLSIGKQISYFINSYFGFRDNEFPYNYVNNYMNYSPLTNRELCEISALYHFDSLVEYRKEIPEIAINYKTKNKYVQYFGISYSKYKSSDCNNEYHLYILSEKINLFYQFNYMFFQNKTYKIKPYLGIRFISTINTWSYDFQTIDYFMGFRTASALSTNYLLNVLQPSLGITSLNSRVFFDLELILQTLYYANGEKSYDYEASRYSEIISAYNEKNVSFDVLSFFKKPPCDILFRIGYRF